MPNTQFYTNSFFHIESLALYDMGKMFSGISFIPTAVIMIILIIFSPVTMQTGIQTRVGRQDVRGLIRVGHIVISLPLIEIINPGFIYFLVGIFMASPTTCRVDIGMLIRLCYIKIGSIGYTNR